MNTTYKEIPINYKRSGNGEPIVFLHGFLENHGMWDEICLCLEKTYTCITIDLLGHGTTPCLGYIHTMEDMAKAVKAVLDDLKVETCAMIGHSMGGYVMLALVDLFPQTITNLVLLNSTSFGDSDEKKRNRDRAISLVKQNPNAYTSMAIANLFAKDNRTKFSSEIEKIRKQAALTPLQGIISALEGMKIRKDRSVVLSQFTGSKTIIAGKDDPVLAFERSKVESKNCTTKFIAFEGGHMTYLENSKKLTSSLVELLVKK